MKLHTVRIDEYESRSKTKYLHHHKLSTVLDTRDQRASAERCNTPQIGYGMGPVRLAEPRNF